MTAPGHRPRHRQEEWDYGGWDPAAPEDPGRQLRERLLQRNLAERLRRRRQDAEGGASLRQSMADSIREQAVEIDLRTEPVGELGARQFDLNSTVS